MLDELKQEGEPILVVDAGNMLFKHSMVAEANKKSWRADADVMIEAQKAVGIEAVNVSHKDLALGIEYLEETSAKGFPWVSANLRKVDGKPTKIPSYRIAEVAGVKVGMIGVSEGAGKSAGKNVTQDYLLIAPFDEVYRAVRELNGKGIDLIVVLSGMTMLRNEELAQKIVGINFIVNGGDARLLRTPKVVGETVILSALNRGKYVGIGEVAYVPGNPHFKVEGEQADIEGRLEWLESQKRMLEGQVTSMPDVQRELAKINQEEAQLKVRIEQMNRPASTFQNRATPLSSGIADRPDIREILKKMPKKQSKSRKQR